MSQSEGWWLKSKKAKDIVGEVVRHEDWIAELDPKKAKKFGISAEGMKEISRYKKNPRKNQDALRLIGVDFGLVRMRVANDTVVCQFSSKKSKTRDILWSIYMFLAKQSKFRFIGVAVSNLLDDSFESWEELPDMKDSLEDEGKALLNEKQQLLGFSDYIELGPTQTTFNTKNRTKYYTPEALLKDKEG